MTEVQPEQPNVYTPVQSSPLAKVGEFMSNWKIKTGLIGTALISLIIGVFVFNFFWSHIVAGMGMKDWSKRAGAAPIECMIKDTNDDGYVSCSAMLRGEVVPLECGSSIFNIGCRVNYGAAAAPQVRPIALPNSGGRS